jgi:hypothetical protein
MMPGSVFLLCAATCMLCSMLLYRAYRQKRVPLLFWSSLCFFGLMIDNGMLYADLHVFPEVQMVVWRKLPGLIATVLLLIGLVWESE